MQIELQRQEKEQKNMSRGNWHGNKTEILWFKQYSNW